MRRELSKEEKHLTKKGLERNKKERLELRANMAYNMALIEKQKEMRKFEDEWRPYLRERKDEEDEKIIKSLASEINVKTETIKVAEEHLTKGVEVKQPSGV